MNTSVTKKYESETSPLSLPSPCGRGIQTLLNAPYSITQNIHASPNCCEQFFCLPRCTGA